MSPAAQAAFEPGLAFVCPVAANDDHGLTHGDWLAATKAARASSDPGRTLQDALMAARAARRAVAEHPAEPAPAPVSAPPLVPGLVTKGPRRRARRSGLRQREDARKMRAHGRALKSEPVEHPSSPLPTPNHSPTVSPSTPTSTHRTTTKRKRGIASWEDAGEKPRLIALNRALPIFGEPFAFSVNLGPDVIKAANDNPRGFLDHVGRRVRLNLKRALGRPVALWCVVETDDDGRPHLHGGLALADDDRPSLVEEALAKAGGNWTRRGSRPADCRVQWEPDGWALYPFKRLARTRQHLRDAAGLTPGTRVAVYSVTADLLAEGKRIHEDVRRAIGKA